MASPESSGSGYRGKEIEPTTLFTWGVPDSDSRIRLRQHYAQFGLTRIPQLVLTSYEDPEDYRKRRDYIVEGLVRFYRRDHTPEAKTYEVDYTVLPVAVADMPPIPDPITLQYSNRLVFFQNGEETTEQQFRGFTNDLLVYANRCIRLNPEKPLVKFAKLPKILQSVSLP